MVALPRRCTLVALSAWLIGAPAAHAFGGPIDVSPGAEPAAGGAAVAGHTGGGATVAWRRASDGAVVARSVTAGGALGAPVTVASTSTAQPPAAAAVPGGTALAWVRPSDDHLLVRRLGDDGTLGTTFDASGESLNFANGTAAMAANASGRVVVAWRRPSDSDVRVRVFDIAAGPSAAALDMTSNPDIALFGTNVQVAVNDAGEAAVVWHRNTDCHILARRVTSAGAVGDQLDVSGQPDSAVGDTSPTVAVRPDGAVVAAWHRDADKHAVGRRWNASGTVDAITDLSPGGGVPSMANLGIAPLLTGDAVAWQRESDKHVVVGTGSAGAFPTPADVSGAASAAATPPAAATTPDSALAVAWVGTDGTARVAFSTGTPGAAPVTPTPTPTAPETPQTTTPAPPKTPGPTPTPRDRKAPDTKIVSGPGKRLRERRASFRFRATERGSRFECSIDRAAFTKCRSRVTFRRLSRGRHVLRVRAVDAAGNRDRSPAVVRFRVPGRRR